MTGLHAQEEEIQARWHQRAAELNDSEELAVDGLLFRGTPKSRVNCKKQVGGGSISNPTLKRYLETYAPFLAEQIDIYNASIILCCGNSGDQNLIFDFVKSQCLPDLEYVPDSDGWVFYSPSTGTIVIDSFHPSARIGYEETYTNMMTGYLKALRHLKSLNLNP